MKYQIKLHLTIIFCVTFGFVGCSKKKTISLNVPDQYSTDSLKKETRVQIQFNVSFAGSVAYSNQAAIAYAKKYASQNSNSCGVYNNDPSNKLSDCAHFIAHCLNAGGIEVKSLEPDQKICPDGLCFRVQELTATLNSLSTQYSNVTLIDVQTAIIGDFAFYNTIIRPTHAFMICEPILGDLDNYKIYAHTTNRNCEIPEPKWYHYIGSAYRITDQK